MNYSLYVKAQPQNKIYKEQKKLIKMVTKFMKKKKNYTFKINFK